MHCALSVWHIEWLAGTKLSAVSDSRAGHALMLSGNTPKQLSHAEQFSAMSNKFRAILPPPPIGGGVDKVLSYADSFVRNSAQPLVSLSPFIIPVLIAVALKASNLFGPLAAVVATIPVLGALLNAENVLRERALLPLPEHKLNGGVKGTAVSS
jgi:hypothetical protein